jgi:hypothetical protein
LRLRISLRSLAELIRALSVEVQTTVGYPGRRNRMESAMVEKTLLALPGKKVSVPRVFKRVVQVALAAGLTAAVMLIVMLGNGLLTGRGASLQGGVAAWLAFIKRPDIYTTIVLTALVTVLFVYWQRDHERR